MNTPFDEWLRQLAAAKKGPVTLRRCSRGRKWNSIITLDGDWTGATMRGQVRLAPDAPGAPLAVFSVSDPEVADEMTTFALSLSAAATGGLPSDTDFSGLEQFAYELLMTPSEGDEELLFGGVLPVLGRVAV